ncbi:hypothetical protein JXQ70_04100 [bacterium]|nr:hypothetical protein [bacterium]
MRTHQYMAYLGLVCISLFSACGSRTGQISQEQHDALLGQKQQLETSLAGLQKTLGTKDDQIREMQERIATLEAHETALQTEMGELRESLSLYRNESQSSQTNVVPGKLGTVEAEYARLIDIALLNCRYLRKHMANRSPGLQFKIENKGARNVERLGLTLYFLDKTKNIIAEESITVISPEIPATTETPAQGTGSLKPKFVMRVPRDESQHIEAAKVPSSWDEGQLDFKICELVIGSR